MANWLARARATISGTAADEARPRRYPRPTGEAANDDAARRWQIALTDTAPMEVIFIPEVTRAEVAAIYPGARIEPLPDSLRRAATQAEADELRELVAVILSDADDAERADVLRVALANAEAALTSFRLLAADAMERKRHEARFGDA